MGRYVQNCKEQTSCKLILRSERSSCVKDGSKIEGQITEQFPGKDVKIETDNGDVFSYKFSQIESIQTEKLNEKMNLWSQIPLLDVIRLNDETTELVGFISSRTLGKDIVLSLRTGTRELSNKI